MLNVLTGRNKSGHRLKILSSMTLSFTLGRKLGFLEIFDPALAFSEAGKSSDTLPIVSFV